jgi:predicted secreted protein
MATTYKGKDGIVKVGANNIGQIRNFSVEQTADTIEDTSMGDTARTYKDSLTQFTASIDALFDQSSADSVTADAAQVAMTIGSTATFKFLPQGDTTGDYQLSGSGIVTSISRSQSYDGLVEISFSIQGSGALTIGTAS